MTLLQFIKKVNAERLSRNPENMILVEDEAFWNELGIETAEEMDRALTEDVMRHRSDMVQFSYLHAYLRPYPHAYLHALMRETAIK